MKLMPQAAIYRAQFQHLLTNQEMATFLAEAPQAGRMLRPLCQMLGVKPLPQMLRKRDPIPSTSAPEKASPEKPPRTRPPAKISAKKALRLFYAEHISPRVRHPLPQDLRTVRPVSLWCRPTRPHS
jgi:hypothetical protein